MQLQGLEAGYFAVVLALVLQFFWMILNRKGANAYISAITQYREPTSTLGRAYGWSIRSVTNSLLEGLLLISTMFFALAAYSFLYATPEAIIASVPILVLVFALSGLTVAQMMRRVQRLAKLEKRILEELMAGIDKIGTARTIVQNLIDRTPLADSRLWFVLFRLASSQDQIGWSVRDVLMEKSKEIDGLRRKQTKPKAESQSQGGAEIA